MKLSGKNFQPWSKFAMSIEGLTAIVGPSNRGKSSISRALKGILRNDLPAEFVKNGQPDKMEVTLETDGHSMMATRTHKGTTKYWVDGEKFEALGKEIPKPMEGMGFGEISLGVGIAPLDPIFAEQNRAQFLIDPDRYKPTELNLILGAFSSTEKLEAGKKEAALRISQRAAETKALAEEIREGEERKVALSALSARAEAVASDMGRAETSARNLEAMGEGLGEAAACLSSLEAVQRLIGSLELPDPSGAVVLEERRKAVERSLWVALRLARLHALADGLPVPDLSGASALGGKAHSAQSAFRHLSTVSFLSGLRQAIDGTVLQWGNTVKEYKALQAIRMALGYAKEKGKSRACAKAMEALIDETSAIVASATSFSKLLTASGQTELFFSNAKNAISALDIAKKACEEQERINASLMESAMLPQIPKCPKCGKDLMCPSCGRSG